MSRWISPARAARTLGPRVAPGLVIRWCREGRLVSEIRGGRLLVERASVAGMLRGRSGVGR